MNPKKTPKKKLRPNNPPPRAVREFTAGGVVFRHGPRGVQILMIRDLKGRWTIAKGHVEKGEKLEQTALREVREETGLRRLKIHQKLDKTYFFYRLEGKLIFMTLYVYLIEAFGDTDRLRPERSEGITGVRWFDADEALKLIEYKNMEKLFRLGLQRIGIKT